MTVPHQAAHGALPLQTVTATFTGASSATGGAWRASPARTLVPGPSADECALLLLVLLLLTSAIAGGPHHDKTRPQTRMISKRPN
jgi:hypothetical protein